MIHFLLVRLALVLALVLPAALVAAAPPVTVLTIEGAIGPATADYAVRGIQRAARDGAQLVVLTVDTPGGLDTSMRSIIKSILASSVPVATYVAPSGARAASAGTYILYASHIAAMAPGTNLGAATPVAIGGPSSPSGPAKPRDAGGEASDDTPTQQPMTRKQVNDAAAYIRSLAQLRGRNSEWAEQAVREAVSLSAEDALKLRVIEVVARDHTDLLKQLDGRKVNVLGQEKVLQTADAPRMEYQPDWRAKLLAVITDPSIALLLLAIGVYGLFFEFMSPGMVLPGVLGGICLLVALYALQLLPVNYAGLALILLGLSFMVAEAFLPSFGTLGLGGVIAFAIGAVILIDTELPGFGIPVALIVTVAALSALTIAAIGALALKARRRPVVSGDHDLLRALGKVVQTSVDGAWVRVHGENWRAVSPAPLRLGEDVRIVARNGLVLHVAPVGNHEKGD